MEPLTKTGAELSYDEYGNTMDVYADLLARGVTLTLDKGGLYHDGPQVALTPAVLSRLERHRDNLLILFQEGARTSFPLSHGQRALWFLHQVAPESPAYNIKFACRVYSEVDVPALQRAFQMLIHRHSMLRTTFPARRGVPAQEVHENQELWFEEIDASQWTWIELTAKIGEAFRRPFDLERGPLLRVNLFSRNAIEHVLLLTVHHLVADRWSMWILAKELQAFYAAETLGLKVPKFSPPPLTYANYVSWQNKLLSGSKGECLWNYWKTQLASELAPLNLPTDRARPSLQTFSGASYEIDLTPELTSCLKKLAQAQGVTLYMVLLAAFQVLLHRYTGQEDILVGSPTAGRNQALFANVVGYFVNLVVVRGDLSGNPMFKTLLAQVRERSIDALRHQDFPFPLLVERLHPNRDKSRFSILQAVFSMGFLSQHAEVPELDFPSKSSTRVHFGGLEIGSFDLDHQEGQFDLDLDIMPAQDSLTARFRYNLDIFVENTISRMSVHYRKILQSVVDDPEQCIGQISLLTPSEREQILVEWNATAHDYPKDLCVHELFEAQAARTPEAPAVVFPSSTSCLSEDNYVTYKNLNQRANQLAHYLRAHGVGRGTLVGLCLGRSVEFVVGVMGILKAGAAYLPIDPAYPLARMAYMLADGQTKMLLTQKRVRERFPEFGGLTVFLDTEWTTIRKERDDNPVLETTSKDLAYVIYTSGSTGRPKGVMIQHRALINLVVWHQREYAVTGADRATQLASLAFDASVWELWPYLTAGASIYIVEEETRMLPAKLVQWLADKKITLTFLPTLLAQKVLQEQWPQHSVLRALLTGGDRLHYHSRKSLPFYLVNHYGPTENTVVTTYNRFQVGQEEDGIPPIGRPIDNTRVYVLDTYKQPVPVGLPGELYIAGDGLAQGYWRRPELTQEKFVADPLCIDPDGRLYRTGDLVRYRVEGQLEFLGRQDTQVKVRGFRIELGEIEAVLGEHVGVQEAVVVVWDQQTGDKALLAYVVPVKNHNLTVKELRGFLNSRLPEYMVPAVFVLLDSIPLTPNGKLDRLALPQPDLTTSSNETGYAPPNTPTEEILAAIWAELLGLNLNKVGIYDSFFELGGHSLLVIQLIVRIRELFGVDLPVQNILQLGTLESMAQAIDRLRRGETCNEALSISGLNLEEEAILNPEICPPQGKIAPYCEPRTILLTGATNFLGSFLLQALLEQTSASIYWLARAEDEAQAWAELRNAMIGCKLWDAIDQTRIKPIIGDLSQPRLGLSEEAFQFLSESINAIYHADALIKLTYPYSALKATNVDGTRWILRLATLKQAIPVHYVSTLLIFASTSYFKGGIIYESDELKDSDHRFIPYADSRWVSEKLVRAAGERGLPITVYRIGHVVGHSRQGTWLGEDHIARSIKGCLQLGKWPKIDILIQPTPVDYMSQAIVSLSRQPMSIGKSFHVAHPTTMTTTQLCEWVRSLGYQLELTSLPNWRSSLIQAVSRLEENELAPLIPLLMDKPLPDGQVTIPQMFAPPMRPKIDCQQTQQALSALSYMLPTIDLEWFARCVGFFIKSGYLDPPNTGPHVSER